MKPDYAFLQQHPEIIEGIKTFIDEDDVTICPEVVCNLIHPHSGHSNSNPDCICRKVCGHDWDVEKRTCADLTTVPFFKSLIKEYFAYISAPQNPGGYWR